MTEKSSHKTKGQKMDIYEPSSKDDIIKSQEQRIRMLIEEHDRTKEKMRKLLELFILEERFNIDVSVNKGA